MHVELSMLTLQAYRIVHLVSYSVHANTYRTPTNEEFTTGGIAAQGLARARKLSKGTDQSSSCVI